MSRLVWLLIVGLLAGCASTPSTRLPGAEGAVRPVTQVVIRYVYVPVDSVLTGPEFIAEGPLSMCPHVAAERKAALQRCNAKLEAIAAKQGTVVEPEGEGKGE
ncbi:hypothetical protein [Arenimonas caeni]|uniref:Lipoprotein n=1 Tax=Arenimonas caeni TaxID=2058085 RepID=A0A2P6M9G2_9GAMM|nr:hypothetical protein [Arenimonas caeni]PRH82629.1 hypothetical protein C6N40_06555 [Arenimonas caeni]